jgi:probable O-glycosylation ligase (exosortase A-associated)
VIKDIILATLLVVFTLWSLRQPWIGAMSWTLVSLMSPHAQWGYAVATWPVATGIAICTLLGLVVTKEKRNPFVGAGPKWLLAFTIWICVTLPGSFFFDQSYPLWERSMKIFLMVFVTLALIDTRKKLTVFIWVNVVAVGFYGVKGGMFTIATGGNYRVWGPGGFIEGNNEVALAVITVIPLMRYLQQQMVHKHAQTIMTVCMALCVVMALGSYSRGALLGVAAMGVIFWLKGRRKLLWGVLILTIGALALSLMPDQWWDRMNTIKGYEADTSAMGRINAWWMAFNLAKDRVLGGGFMIWTAPIFQKYAPVREDVHAAHSLYFQVMGEHGFIGLFLFLGIGASTWRAGRWLTKTGQLDKTASWAADLGPMIQVSMIGYGVAGAFLSLAYFDLPYNLMIMAVAAQRILRAEQAARVAEARGNLSPFIKPRARPDLPPMRPHR